MVTGVEDPKPVGRVRSVEDMNCAINDLASKFASMSTMLDETRSATMGGGGNHSNRKGNNHVIIEQRVKDNQKARILKLKRRNHEDYSSTKEDLYACMTRSSTKKLFTSFEEPERVLHSTKKLFKITSLDYSSLPEFDLFFDLENQSEEEVTKAMTELTVEITRIDYDSGTNEKGRIELKGRLLLELRDKAFSRTNGEDAVEHIENFMKIVESLNVPNITHDRVRVSVLPFSLTGDASKWWKDESIGSITTWVDLTDVFLENSIHLLVLIER
ncbi:hypothetical protein Tco_0418206 [Tanacetum coccineum]